MLIVFGVAMAVSLGVESPLSYSVFSAASGAAAYAVLGTTPLREPDGTESIARIPRRSSMGGPQRIDVEAGRAAQAVLVEHHWKRWWT